MFLILPAEKERQPDTLTDRKRVGNFGGGNLRRGLKFFEQFTVVKLFVFMRKLLVSF